MKYFTYLNPPSREDASPEYITMSEEEIINSYFDHWYEKMCDKFGKEYVDNHYTKEDCIDDWVVINLAWGGEE
jgi:hypothetical protein